MEINATFKTRGRTYTAVGTSVPEAIGAIAFRNGKGMGVLTVARGDKSKTKILSAPQVYRLFSLSRLTREVALKETAALFEGV